jgi:hypothetical protein
MKKMMKRSAACFAAGVLMLVNVGVAVSAMDDDFSYGQVYGLSFSGSFDFSSMKLSGFAHNPTEIEGSTVNSTPFFYIDNGIAKSEIPLLTFGSDVQYPGIFYNSGDTQFMDLVANAAEGDSTAISTVTMYAAAAGVGITLGLVGLDASTGGGSIDCSQYYVVIDMDSKVSSLSEKREIPEQCLPK